MNVTLKRGSLIIEVTEGRKMPETRVLGSDTVVRKVEIVDGVLVFKFERKEWTTEASNIKQP